METVIIDPRGDVCLVANGGEQKASFLVNSVVLILASEVFAALLGPNFREGQTLAQAATPPEIVLPEDDATGMRILLEVLHHQPAPAFLKKEELAAVVDKYGCQSIFRAYAKVLLEGAVEEQGASPEIVDYLGIAIAFDIWSVIYAIVLDIAITTGLKQNESNTAARIKDIPLKEVVPEGFCRGVDEYRRSLHNRISEELLDLTAKLNRMTYRRNEIVHRGQDVARHDEVVCATFLKHLRDLSLMPGGEDSGLPVLTRCLRLDVLANKMANDPALKNRFIDEPLGGYCNACSFMRELDEDLFTIFTTIIAGNRGKPVRAPLEGQCAFTDTLWQDDEYSAAFKLLFGDRLGRKLKSFSDDRDVAWFRDVLCEEQGFGGWEQMD